MFDDNDMKVRMAAYNYQCSCEIREKLKECKRNYRRCARGQLLWFVMSALTIAVPLVGRKSREKCRDFKQAKGLWKTYIDSFKQRRLA